MSQPLTIASDKVTSDQPFDQATPPNGNINPTSTTPGLNFPSTNPTINVTVDQPAALTVINIPTDRPNQPTNVDEFTVTFVYPNGTTSEPFPSETPLTGVSPQVDLPANFEVPDDTVIMISDINTKDGLSPKGVCTT